MGQTRRHVSRRLHPSIEGLEHRALLTSSSTSYFTTVAHHAYDEYVGTLRRIELSSQATPAEFLALRDDSRAISAAASAPGASGSLAGRMNGVIAASLLIDRSLLQGWLSDQGWSEVKAKLTRDLSGSNVPVTLIEKTTADMKAAAVSAGVDPGTADVLSADLASYQSARNQAQTGFHDPQVYYTQHLRGFFRGWAIQRTNDDATLQSDLTSIAQSSPGKNPNVLHRDTGILQSLGAVLVSDSNQRLTDAYATAFAPNGPTSNSLATFRATAIVALGTLANTSRTSAVDRLIADAPAFYGVANSQANVQTIVNDVRTVVDDGAGSTLNPFNIVIRPGG